MSDGFDFLPDPGEAASLIRAHDWASTPLGHPSQWSASLRNVVRFIIAKPFRECWHEVYDVLGPMVDTPFNGGPSSWLDDMELIVRRHGFPEESHFTGSYSPVPDDTAPRGIGPEHLVQCVVNLLTNAAKYSPPKSDIRVETHGEDSEARKIENARGQPALRIIS